MISALAKDAGDHYDVETMIRGSGDEIAAEARSILKVIYSQEPGPMMINLILEDFADWRREAKLEREPIDYKARYEDYLKKSEVIISQLRTDRDKLLEIIKNYKPEIMPLESENIK